MPLQNSSSRFGSISRFFHWSIALLFLYQYLGANIMTRLGKGALFGMDANFFYNWHKSIGLLIAALVIGRLIWRVISTLPDWHEHLTTIDQRITKRLETTLYILMFLLPITGYLFVMAGGYGIKLFGIYDLTNPIGKQPSWSWAVWTLHVAFAYAALIVIAWHVGLMLRKHFFERSGILNRMLPFR